MARKVKFDFNPFKGFKFERKSDIKDAKNEIKKFVPKEIKKMTLDGMSPVSGRGRWEQLSVDYAKAKKRGNRKANLKLKNVMLPAIRVLEQKPGSDTLRIEVRPSKANNKKVQGHNNFDGDSPIPTRRFIPDKSDGETFKRAINTGIKNIVKKYASDDE